MTELRITTRILTDYRAVAHLVEGIGLFIIVFLQCILIGVGVQQAIYFVNGSLETIKGALLLNGITKSCPKRVKIYLFLSAITLVLKKILVIFLLVVLGNGHYMGGIIIPVVVVMLIYFSYEWFLFYHVYQLHDHLKSVRMEKWNLGPIVNEENLHNPV